MDEKKVGSVERVRGPVYLYLYLCTYLLHHLLL